MRKRSQKHAGYGARGQCVSSRSRLCGQRCRVKVRAGAVGGKMSAALANVTGAGRRILHGRGARSRGAGRTEITEHGARKFTVHLTRTLRRLRRAGAKAPVGKKIGFSVPSLLTLVLFSVIMALSFCEVRLFAALRGADSPFTNGGQSYEIFTQAFIR